MIGFGNYLKTKATNFYNSYRNLRLPYKILIPVVALGIGTGIFYGNKVIDYGSRLAKNFGFFDSSLNKTKPKKTDETVKSTKSKSIRWVQRQYKIEKKGDFDHNKIEDLVLKDESGNLHMQFGWYNPYTKKVQYLTYETLRKRLQKNSPSDVKRYDNLVLRLLN